MGRLYVTQLVDEANPILVYCPRRPFATALARLLRAANFAPQILTDKQAVTSIIKTGEPPLFLWIDVPETDEAIRLAVCQLVRDWQCRLVYVGFDTLGEKTAPTLNSLTPTQTHLIYWDVFEPDVPTLSAIDAAIRRGLKAGKRLESDELVYPLWYEDCAAHLVQQVVMFKPGTLTWQATAGVALSAFLQGEVGKRWADLLPENITLSPHSATVIASRPLTDFKDILASVYETCLPPLKSETKAISKPLTPPRLRKAKVAALSLLACGLVGVALFFAAGVWQVGRLQNDLQQLYGKPPEGRALGAILQQAESGLQTASFFARLQAGGGRETLPALSVLQLAVQGSREILQAQDEIFQSYQIILAGREGDGLAKLQSADLKLDDAYQNLSIVQARLLQDNNFLPQALGGKQLQNYLSTALPEMRKSITTTRSLIATAPDIFGKNGKRLYALVFQDATELRASGGKIVAVATLEFEKGKLLDMQVYPVASLDSMLPGAVAAPTEVQNYLRTQSWQLKDANWDADYQQAAAQISWFLNKQLQKNVDGVMVLNSSSLPSLLAATGKLTTSSGKEISSANVAGVVADALLAQTKKPDALSSLYTESFAAVLGKWQKLNSAEMSAVGNSLGELFNSSQALVSFGNANTQRSFSALGWDGNLMTPVCPSLFSGSGCVVTAAMVVEENLSGNNIAPFLKHNHQHKIQMGDSLLVHERTETIENTASSNNWPLGSYQTLLKFIVDEHAVIQGATLNGVALRPGQITFNHEAGRVVAKISVEVTPGSKAVIRLIYTTPGVQNSNSALVFFEQKQPGSESDPYQLRVEYPQSYTPKTIAPQANYERNAVIFQGRRDQNRLYAVGF